MYNNFPNYYNNYLNYHYPLSTDFPSTGISPKDLQDINNAVKNSGDELSGINDVVKNEKSDITNKEKIDFKLGPIQYRNNTLSFFNISFEIDDLLIIGLILILFLDNNGNYITIIILGLLLFNIKIPSFGIFS